MPKSHFAAVVCRIFSIVGSGFSVSLARKMLKKWLNGGQTLSQFLESPWRLERRQESSWEVWVVELVCPLTSVQRTQNPNGSNFRWQLVTLRSLLLFNRTDAINLISL